MKPHLCHFLKHNLMIFCQVSQEPLEIWYKWYLIWKPWYVATEIWWLHHEIALYYEIVLLMLFCDSLYILIMSQVQRLWRGERKELLNFRQFKSPLHFFASIITDFFDILLINVEIMEWPKKSSKSIEWRKILPSDSLGHTDQDFVMSCSKHSY